ncbi:DUF3592 domain-containing protein [Dyadobacter sp. CY345]|uniref:DUF3592 domain-containing protein n=1 Tax=Dyadobacter sp. CY345 TaxID=2909335 RepID=UPI001F342DFA|nr:DUF3592 domain-containing protein [Dyadobacter sp. CY345]MCF2443198.1 DUF3592 domain-containing protein [Dyadobacter sp. CY345]
MELITIQIVGLLEGAAIVLMILAAWRLVLVLARPRKMSIQEIEKNGTLAEAIVLDVNETGMFIDDLPQVKLQMQVLPEKGRNFVAEVKQVLPNSLKSLLRLGSKILVKYDPGNPRDVVVLRAL